MLDFIRAEGSKNEEIWFNCRTRVTLEERSKKLREFVGSIPKVKKPEQGYDWLEDAMNRNPKLTREGALEMARAFGFY